MKFGTIFGSMLLFASSRLQWVEAAPGLLNQQGVLDLGAAKLLTAQSNPNEVNVLDLTNNDLLGSHSLSQPGVLSVLTLPNGQTVMCQPANVATQGSNGQLQLLNVLGSGTSGNNDLLDEINVLKLANGQSVLFAPKGTSSTGTSGQGTQGGGY